MLATDGLEVVGVVTSTPAIAKLAGDHGVPLFPSDVVRTVPPADLPAFDLLINVHSLHRLDDVCRIFGRADESVRFDRKPSEQLTEQMGFTPMPNEDVGRLVRESNPDLYLFSSDYPHIEGTKDPIGRFERSLAEVEEPVKEKFYTENFLRLWPEARVA